MTPAPRFLVNLWFKFERARYARRLGQPGQAVAAQEKIFSRLVAASSRCAYGRAHGLRTTSSYDHFRSAVPPATHAGLAPFITRLTRGEADVLAPGPCRLFAETAGTTGGTPQRLPVPAAMLRHYRAGLRAAWFLLARRAGHPGALPSRRLHAAARPEGQALDLDGILARPPYRWLEAPLHPPSTWPDDPASIGMLFPRDVSSVSGTPAATQALAQALLAPATTGQPSPATLASLWPSLDAFLHTGAPLGLHADSLRQAFGPGVHFHEIYAAAEGIIAAQDGVSTPGLRLLTDTGLFFEFLPLDAYHAATLASAGKCCVPLAGVRAGVDYVLLLTTPAGLCRHVLGDIVRFLSVEPPRLRVVGRLQGRLNLCGEQADESVLLDALVAVCRANGWQPVHCHVAPYVRRVAAGQTILCHEWWLELRTRTVRTPTANVLAPGLDAELSRRLPAYAACRAGLKLAEPSVRLAMPGVFARWSREYQPAAAGGGIVASRSDRLIADQLAALAGFHQESAPTFTPRPDSARPF